MKTIIVTGSNGFVGRHLLQALGTRFPSATIVATSRTGGSGVVPLDVTDAAAVRALVSGLRPNACIHLAALASVDQSFQASREVWNVNVCGTLNVADALLDLAPRCRLVHASSGEIYGLSLRDDRPVDEDTPLSPASPYAVTKAAADLALGEMTLRGLRVIRLRLFNHTGPGQTERYVVPRLAAQVARIAEGAQEPVIYSGALDRWRDFLDVRDVVDAYLAALDSLTDGLCVNVCSGVARCVSDILATLIEMAQIKADVVENISQTRRTDIRAAVGSPLRAAALLGWRPRMEWSETLHDVLNYWRRQAVEARDHRMKREQADSGCRLRRKATHEPPG
jgi:GDP-4-dehydro-6-deoxy-D-mannose reductase